MRHTVTGYKRHTDEKGTTVNSQQIGTLVIVHEPEAKIGLVGTILGGKF